VGEAHQPRLRELTRFAPHRRLFMRVIIIGSADERRRLREALENSPPQVVGEFGSLADARAAGMPADALLKAIPVDVDDDEESGPERLTTREIEVLQLLADGLPNKSIASRLGISDQTVKFHVSSIYGKLGAANRTDAVRRAVRRGLLAL
jgi:DNA-binding NarL/FixJ family response regulator